MQRDLTPLVVVGDEFEAGREMPAGSCPVCRKPALLDDAEARQRRAGPVLYTAMAAVVLKAEAQAEYQDHEGGKPGRKAWRKLHELIMSIGTAAIDEALRRKHA